MVDQDHVDAALRKLGRKDETGNPFQGSHQLMFEQQSWDNVLKKMGNGA
jgi:AP-1-like factor